MHIHIVEEDEEEKSTIHKTFTEVQPEWLIFYL